MANTIGAVPDDDAASAPGVRSSLSLGTVGQVIASSVILLPVIGFLGTSLSLYLNRRVRSYGAFSVALDHSVQWLAWRGAISFLGLGIFGLGALTGSLFSRVTIGRRLKGDQSPHRNRLRGVTIMAFGAVLFLLPLVFIDFVIGTIAIVMSPLLVWSIVRQPPQDRLRFPRLWLPLAILALASTVSVAVIPNPLETGLVTFSKGVSIPKGVYAVLGSDGSQTFLLACAKNMPLVSVNNNSILSVVYEVGSGSAPLQGLYQILRNGRSPELGAVTQCPHSK